jgi:hypothetical protein
MNAFELHTLVYWLTQDQGIEHRGHRSNDFPTRLKIVVLDLNFVLHV